MGMVGCIFDFSGDGLFRAQGFSGVLASLRESEALRGKGIKRILKDRQHQIGT